MERILILSGPHLDRLGDREPEIYGGRDLDQYLKELRTAFPGREMTHFQSNVEGELVQALRDAERNQDGVVLNAAGYSHTSVALHDAIKLIGIPVVEVHISNIHAREEFRHNTLTGSACKGVITGFGLEGYALAIRYLIDHA